MPKIPLTQILEKQLAAAGVIKNAAAEELAAHDLEVAAAAASANAIAAGMQIEAHTAAALNPPEGPVKTITSDGHVFVGTGGATFLSFVPEHSDLILIDDPDAPPVVATEATAELQNTGA
jgi:hypothetical protein